jgi:hypothetical protein
MTINNSIDSTNNRHHVSILHQKLKEITGDVRILFMTAFDVPGNLLDSMPNINDSDIIRKPIEEERFIIKIKTAKNLE